MNFLFCYKYKDINGVCQIDNVYICINFINKPYKYDDSTIRIHYCGR
jgi:hypothetical protein